MDLAYDNIAKESLPDDAERSSSSSSEKKPEPSSTLNEDIQEAYRAFSSSPWGTWLGGQVGKVVKQGGEVYREAQQEVTSLGVDAGRGLAQLRARAISLTTALPRADSSEQQSGDSSSRDKDKESETTPTAAKDGTMEDGMKQSETYLSKLRAEAAKRLKDLQRAEDAADEALLSFGKNFRDFLQDAIVFRPGTAEDAQGQGGTQHRFESKDESGKRVIHTSRYDAQLHVVHTSEKSFTEDPASPEYAAWAQDFDVESKTEGISSDLAKYPELRANMEKLVPDTVPYADFWKRYYFLRHSIETAEARRRDLLKAASAEEEIGWGEESDDETTPAKSSGDKEADKPVRPESSASTTTIQPPPATGAAAASDKSRLKASEPRKSNDEKSQADSDTSYDLVGAASGNPSQAPSSPKDSRKAEDSDDEDDSSDDDEEDSDDEEWE
ncbi:hypothetical protein SLS62_004257 [Diatrype stigma]|uniref:BSD domain-containing protein n=1 Tax=Diatrype stigma TaxID=117547 RepID=A0AAN9YQS7_9PEZI